MLEFLSDIWDTLSNKSYVHHLNIFWCLYQYQYAFYRPDRTSLKIGKGLYLDSHSKSQMRTFLNIQALLLGHPFLKSSQYAPFVMFQEVYPYCLGPILSLSKEFPQLGWGYHYDFHGGSTEPLH